MSIQSNERRLKKLEARRRDPERTVNPDIDPERYNRTMSTLAEALGDMLGIDPADVAAELPGALAGIGGTK